jgi:NADPH-dependent 2,4-dienoyl-CoA reductase/sulfur reductase-like enzyme
MRTKAAGIRPAGRRLTFTFDGEELSFLEGDALAAALVDAGRLTCRTGRSGDPRGVFCGMGVCQECVVLVDGVPTRACMTAAHEGARVEVLAAGLPAPRRAEAALEHVSAAPDVLVVGGGPAGLAAAASAAEAGADVLLLDERSKLGGQYFKQPSGAFAFDGDALDRQYRRGRALIERALAAGVTVETGTPVWAATAPSRLFALSETRALTLCPRRLVIASGAYERAVPLPGWTLPGFMTTGAAQTLLRAYQVLPGERVLLSGNGPLNVQVGAELVRAGACVVALCEAAPRPGLDRAPALARMAAAAPQLVVQGSRYVRALRAAGAPVLYGHAVVAADGVGRVERATVARLDRLGVPIAGSERTFEVDAVCAGFGFLPSNELARALGVSHRFDPLLRQLVTVRTPPGRTSVEGVWVVGDGGGTGGARVAEAAGTLAGLDAARSLGLEPSSPARTRSAERELRRGERFQRALAALYAAPTLLDELARPDTLVCRCEEVPLGAVEQELRAGTATSGAVKRVTRAGMGRCQGRYCGPVLVELAARAHARTPDEWSGFAPAPPFKPLPAGVIAAATAMRDAPERTA